MTSFSSTGIAYDREGPRGQLPIVLIHAGVADRRMWDPVWSGLTSDWDVVRVDLRGFGDSTGRPAKAFSQAEDLLGTLAEIGVHRCHLIGASFGAGVAVEVSLIKPSAVASLLLAAPAGSLIAELTPDLREFITAEGSALERGDLNTAVEANLSTWVEGLHRRPDQVDPVVRQLVGRMQRQAFEITADWSDVEEKELEPPALERLAAIAVPLLVLIGGLDLDAVQDAAARVAATVPGAHRVDWPDAGHLPSLEQPDTFLELVRGWLQDHLLDKGVRRRGIRPPPRQTGPHDSSGTPGPGPVPPPGNDRAA